MSPSVQSADLSNTEKVVPRAGSALLSNLRMKELMRAAKTELGVVRVGVEKDWTQSVKSSAYQSY